MNILISVIRTAVKANTKFDALTYCRMFWNVKAQSFEMTVRGLKESKPVESSDDIFQDDEANKMRLMFMQSASDIPGEVEATEIEIDFLLNRATQVIYYITPGGIREKRNYTL